MSDATDRFIRGRGWARLSGWAPALAVVLGLVAGCASAAAAEVGAWLLPDGRPRASAVQALDLLDTAASHGLRPDDYAAGALRTAVQLAARQGLAPPADARLAQALDAAMQRFLSDLGNGRVDPRQLNQQFTPARRDPFDAAALLQAALSTGTLADVVRQAAPVLPQYQQLRQALATYRALADHPAWRELLPALPVAPKDKVRPALPAKLSPAQAYAGLALLADRLRALGDLPPDAPLPAVYEGALVDAVRTFQQRHGLTDDGVIGAATLAALQVPPAARIRQIEWALERLRWTPLLQGPRMVVVNIPEFMLRAYEVVDGRPQVRQQMKVIVGKSLDTRTPLFDEDMQYIEFSPYWNVPPSIARAETVPRLRRDPGYFERDRRDFSHGCIRVEQPVALASFVLQGQTGPERWSDDRIRQAMAQGRSTTLRLDAPVPVLIAYGTSLVKAGRIHFFHDLYGQDRVLDAALRQARPALPAPD